VKKIQIALIFIPAAALWLVFAGCASRPSAPAAPEPAPLVEAPVAVVTEPIVEEAPVAVVPEPVVEETPVVALTEPVVEEAPAAEVNEKQALAEEERQEALKALARADEVQGKNAEKIAYNTAASVFANGDRNMGKQDWDAAYFDFHSARESFDLLTVRVTDRRQQALNALNRSKVRADESEAFALAADSIAPQSEEVE
jgi:type IV secretory pathway VirB10-like protein